MRHRSRKRRQPSTETANPPIDARDGVAAPYRAYAVAPDGSRAAIEARSIVIDLGVGGLGIEIKLHVAHPILRGQLSVQVTPMGEGLLIVGHGDASGVHVGVEPFVGGKSSRLKPP